MINFGKKKEEKSKAEGRKMHKAVCSNCGNKCELPFKPTEGKPVFCSDCYKEKRNANSLRSNAGARKMHKAVCSNCGNNCELPFKPTGDKPVFCSDCYGKSGHGESKSSKHSPGQFDILNSKLDKILEMLEGTPAKATPKKEPAEKKKVVKKVVKKPIKKTPVKKKATTKKKK